MVPGSRCWLARAGAGAMLVVVDRLDERVSSGRAVCLMQTRRVTQRGLPPCTCISPSPAANQGGDTPTVNQPAVPRATPPPRCAAAMLSLDRQAPVSIAFKFAAIAADRQFACPIAQNRLGRRGGGVTLAVTVGWPP